MLYYICDGSFDGLLTAIYEAYYRRETPEKILLKDDTQENLFVQKVYIATVEEKAKRVYYAIQTKISHRALRNVFYVYLSELKNAGTWIYQYLRLGWKMGKHIDLHLSNDAVNNVHQIKQKVAREAHLMIGLIRFRKLNNNIYYAPIEPQYNILGLIAAHFTKRMPAENWMIHDVNRKIAAIYDQEKWIIIDIDFPTEIKLGEDEKIYQQLWREYFQHISIKNRKNLKLQKRNMPMKYWRYLVEKEIRKP